MIRLKRSTRDDKKYMVLIDISAKRGQKAISKTVHFGQKGYSDYTKHKDYDRMKNYLARHKTRENWGKSGITTAGFWSRWLLWNKPTLKDSIKDVEKRFKVKISH